jgi:uncharacterized protein YdcH (DUF465 family)
MAAPSSNAFDLSHMAHLHHASSSSQQNIMAFGRGDELMRVKPQAFDGPYARKRAPPVSPAAPRRKMAGFQPTKRSSIMHIPHELQEEFSTHAGLIERLRRTNYEFGRLTSQYEEVNRNIYRIESEEAPSDDAVVEGFKKERLMLKDEIASFLAWIERRM